MQHPQTTSEIAKRELPAGIVAVCGAQHDGRLLVTVGLTPRRDMDTQGVFVDVRCETADLEKADEAMHMLYAHATHIAPAGHFVKGQAETFRAEVAMPATDETNASWFVRGRVVFSENGESRELASEWVPVNE